MPALATTGAPSSLLALSRELTRDDAAVWARRRPFVGNEPIGFWVFLAERRPDLLLKHGVPWPSSEVQSDVDLYLSHAVVGEIERRLGYESGPAVLPDKLIRLRDGLAASVVIGRGTLVSTIAIAVGVGFLLGFLIARRRPERSSTRTSRTSTRRG